MKPNTDCFTTERLSVLLSLHYMHMKSITKKIAYATCHSWIIYKIRKKVIRSLYHTKLRHD